MLLQHDDVMYCRLINIMTSLSVNRLLCFLVFLVLRVH